MIKHSNNHSDTNTVPTQVENQQETTNVNRSQSQEPLINENRTTRYIYNFKFLKIICCI